METQKSQRGKPNGVRAKRIFNLLAIGVALGGASAAYAQSTTHLLLAGGWGVQGHAGYVFGPISSLAMNEAKEIVFLSTLRGTKRELRAVIRSTGVTFSVVAFEGLRSPLPKTFYESFSMPSLNNSGVIAFTAVLKDEVPSSAVIRVAGATAEVVASSGTGVPGIPEATFEEFSAPFINSAGNILFAARTGGKQPGTGMFLWTRGGMRSVPLPPELKLGPKDLLNLVFFSRDEAVFVPRGTLPEAVTEQFFRAITVKNFQELKPAPQQSEIAEVLASRPGQTRVQMLLVLVEGEKVETAALDGDPSQAVVAKLPPGATLKPLGRIQSQTAGARENIIFAAAPADQESDLALYCFCDGQVTRLTSVEEFRPITEVARGRPIYSLASDSHQTVTFIAPCGEGGDAVGIYVTSLP